MTPEVTILLVTFNSLPFLRVAIKSIRQNTNIAYKVLVVDNGSSYTTAKYLTQEGIDFIRNAQNEGYIYAQHQGFQLVDTPYLCSCNDDIVVTKGWLNQLLKKMKENPKIKICAPVKCSSRLLYPYDTRISSREAWDNVKKSKGAAGRAEAVRLFTKGNSLERFAKDFRKINKYGDRFIESPPDFIPGFCFLTETEVWKNIGGFVDRSMRLYGTEDVERCWRLGLSGYKILKTDSVYVHHIEGGSVAKNNIRTDRAIMANNRILLDKMGRYLWEWLRRKLKSKSIDKILDEHWLVLQLFQNARKNQVPKDLLVYWHEYEEHTLQM